MEEKSFRTLKIDPQFKSLIRPLLKIEYIQLEKNIIADGCRDPITVWHDTIIDGHNRYEICIRHNIPFYIAEKEFVCREEAIAWICANQLGRRNLSDEIRKYLIGKQYESERIVSRIRNPNGVNQYSVDKIKMSDTKNKKENSRHNTAARIADENNISRGTVEKYAIYSRAVDLLAKKSPDIVSKILSGQYKIAHKNVVELSKLNHDEIKKVEQKIQKMQEPYIKYNKLRDIIYTKPEKSVEKNLTHTIKDMPAFDPDADINVLTLTIPSWASSINRVRTQTDLSIISKHARDSLIRELESLIKYVNEMIAAIVEE